MPRYYCDYCDTYLTHDSPVVRKQHNTGYKHKANVRQYYLQFEEAQSQDSVDTRILEHLARAGAPDPSKLTAGSIPGSALNGMMRPGGLPNHPLAMPGAAAPQFANIPPTLQAPRPLYGGPAVLPVPGGMYRPPQTLQPPRQFAAPYPQR